MIIGVKSTRSGPDNTTPAERYAHSTDKKKSKTPYAFAMFLVGVAVYLKSIFPSQTREDAAVQPHDDDETGHASAQLDPMQQAGLDEDIQTGSTTSDDSEVGSGSRLVDLQSPATFMLVDSPDVGRFLPPESPLVWSDIPQNARQGGAANDNSGGAPAGNAGGGSETDGPGEPGGNGGPDTHGPCVDGTCWPGVPHDEPDCGCEGSAKAPPPPPPPAEDEAPDEESCGCSKSEASTGSNRAPRVSGPVHLTDMSGGAVLVIAMSDLLRHATDPDGDELKVVNLTTSSGSLEGQSSGWRYTAEPQFTGQVTLTYEVSDGVQSVLQTATFSVLEQSDTEGTNEAGILGAPEMNSDAGAADSADNIQVLASTDVMPGIIGGDGDELSASESANIIVGTAGNDIIHGGPGNDRIYGEAGHDIIFGGDGDDIIYGGDGDDVIYDGQGSDRVYGGNGDDHVIAALDQADDIYDGGEGHDTLDYSAASQSLLIDLESGSAQGVEIGNDTISGFEVVLGGTGNDHFIAGGASVALGGGGGENIFEFLARPMAAPHAQPVSYEILDFTVGDLIRMSKYDLFEKSANHDEDDFEKIYGTEVSDDDLQIRYRHEYEDMKELTVVDMLFNDPDAYDMSIILHGHRMLLISETA